MESFNISHKNANTEEYKTNLPNSIPKKSISENLIEISIDYSQIHQNDNQISSSNQKPQIYNSNYSSYPTFNHKFSKSLFLNCMFSPNSMFETVSFFESTQGKIKCNENSLHFNRKNNSLVLFRCHLHL